MTTETAVEQPAEGKEKEQNPLLEIARKVLLASIGAMALTQDEIEKFINKLIERGEIAEKDGRKLIQEVVDRRKKKAEEAKSQAGKHLEEILERINIPSKADIEALSEKIAELTRKIEELKKT